MEENNQLSVLKPIKKYATLKIQVLDKNHQVSVPFHIEMVQHAVHIYADELFMQLSANRNGNAIYWNSELLPLDHFIRDITNTHCGKQIIELLHVFHTAHDFLEVALRLRQEVDFACINYNSMCFYTNRLQRIYSVDYGRLSAIRKYKRKSLPFRYREFKKIQKKIKQNNFKN